MPSRGSEHVIVSGVTEGHDKPWTGGRLNRDGRFTPQGRPFSGVGVV